MSWEYFDTLLLVRLCMGKEKYIPQTVRKTYTTFSTEQIVALRSFNKIFPESYDFAVGASLQLIGVNSRWR
jgi:hypothetical protein